MTEMRRRAVKAICEAHMLEPGHECSCMAEGGVGFAHVPGAILCRDTAEEIYETVLRAMREPTDAMRSAFEVNEGIFCGIGYNDMIDAALREPSERAD